MRVSVIIPCYNAASWLPMTIPRIEESLHFANVKNAEIIVVDDGSTDNSVDVAHSLNTRYPLRVISQPNLGRLLARKKGTSAARYDTLLFIDTRVFIEIGALKFVSKQIAKYPDRLVWSSHVNIDKKGNMYARFWDAITRAAWYKYFSNPRFVSFGEKDFDLYPKGTTCLLLQKSIFEKATEWYIKTNKRYDGNSNDDTAILRRISSMYKINVSPNFSCIYHSRNNLRNYTKHAYHRGKVFVDGFIKDSKFYSVFIYSFLIFSFPTLLIFAYIIYVNALLALSLVFGGMILIMATMYLFFKINFKDCLSFVTLLPVFVIFYGSGIWAATLSKIKRAL